MDSSRKSAIIVGVLFIIGTAAGILSVIAYTPVLNQPDYLARVSANPNQIILGALFVLLMGFALALGRYYCIQSPSSIIKSWRLGMWFSGGRLRPLLMTPWLSADCC
jgi:hypothetical protein